MGKVVIGFDTSWTCPGIAVVDLNGKLLASASFPTENIKSHKGLRRLLYIKERFTEFLKPHAENIAAVYIEGPSLFSDGKPYEKGKPAGIASLCVAELGVEETIEIPPTSLKMHFQGMGNASKAEMVQRANELFGLSLELKNNDEADAIAVAYCGSKHFRNEISFESAKALKKRLAKEARLAEKSAEKERVKESKRLAKIAAKAAKKAK